MVSTSAQAQGGWLFGPVPDLVFGAGLLYLLTLCALSFGGGPTPAFLPSGSIPILIMLFSGSHYGGTLLRVYESREERSTYRTFTVHATLLIIALLIGALRFPIIGSFLITLYMTWSPWHYTGQNYGITMMFLRRRGVEVSPVARRCLHASFVLSYLSVFLNAHFVGGIAQADPLGITAEASTHFQFVSLGLPASIRSILLPLVGLGYVSSLAVAGFLLLRAGGPRAVAPAGMLVFTQAVWFSIPHLAFYLGFADIIPAMNLGDGTDYVGFFLWIALGHAIQYLWITAYYARRESRWRGFGNYFAKVFIFGNAVWAAPVALFGPDSIGGPEYSGGLALSVAAAVNLHHFIVDGAIWKLRNPKVAAVLLRARDAVGAKSTSSTGPPWKRRSAWAVAAAFCLIGIVPMIDIDRRFPEVLQAGDHEAAAAILDRAALYGHDSGALRARVANRLVADRSPAAALPHYRRSLELKPQADGYLQLGILTERLSGTQAALIPWKRGSELFPDDYHLTRRAGVALVKLQREAEAVRYFERAVDLRPDDEWTKRALDKARARVAR